jgi:D-arabinose 1-dehydrogenase-like Zn-dependent alcohol dehydrogenase
VTLVNRARAPRKTIVGRHGGFADRVRAQWTWVRPIPEALDLATSGRLLCGGVTPTPTFAPLAFLTHVRERCSDHEAG